MVDLIVLKFILTIEILITPIIPTELTGRKNFKVKNARSTIILCASEFTPQNI